ncbi:MAG: Crp/Fnr family transcriptional regulator [Candidatus Acidiferrales bacterium]
MDNTPAQSLYRSWAIRSVDMKIKESNTKSLDPEIFLDITGIARKAAEFGKDEPIFCQGDPAKSVKYIQDGNVKFSVVNGTGRVAVVAMFGPSDFFGEGCMAGQSVRSGTATAITPTTLFSIDKNELLHMLHTRHQLSNHFVEYMLSRNNRVEEDLIDQLFNSCEKRLARTLLVLGRYGKAQHQLDSELPNVTQETLSEIVGTTRSRVNFFMNKFRKLGFIEYHRRRIKINKSLLTFVLDE